jgi:AcrR family transcriptional regulator
MISATGLRPRTRAPRQQRSAATYARLLDAAEALLQERSFDAVTLADIARRADVTIGAFYARFADKGALLEALEARLTEEVLEVMRRATDPARWTDVPVEEAMRRFLHDLVLVYRRTRGAGRALVLRSHTDLELRRRLERLNSEGLPRVLSFLLTRGGIRHPNPKLALRIGLLVVRSTLRETILFGEKAPGGAVPPAVLADQLAAMFVRYLESPSSTR